MKDNIFELNINAKLDWDHVWHMECPQWAFKQEGKDLAKMVALLMAEVEMHVKERGRN